MEGDAHMSVAISCEGSRSQGVFEINSEAVTPFNGNQRRQNALSKLEVLRARQINLITAINATVCILGLVLSISYSIWTRTAGFEYLERTTADGRKLKIPSFKTGLFVTLLDSGANIIMVLFVTVLTPVYLLRVFRNNKRPVTSEQVMVGCFLVMNWISVNPFFLVVGLHNVAVNNTSDTFYRPVLYSRLWNLS